MGGREVLEHVQAFAEVCANGGFDDFAAGLGHQASHARELRHLAGVASSTGVGEEVDGVEVLVPRTVGDRCLRTVVVSTVVADRLLQLLGEVVSAAGPEVQQVVVSLTLGDRTTLVGLLDPVRLLLGGREQFKTL